MKNDDPALGRRIAVVGVTGSGKTTFARALSEALDLPLVELDAIHWQTPGWQMLPLAQFRSQVQAALDAAPAGWVTDGNYKTQVGDLVQVRADTIVWLNLPLRITFGRVLQRTLSRAWTKELMWGVQRESWRLTFLSRNSILWWSLSHHRESLRRTRQLIEEAPAARAYEVRSAKEAAALLRAANASAVR